MKIAKRTLSIVLALIMAFGVFSIVSSAAPVASADYTAVNAAIDANVPSTVNRYFYTDQANTLIDNVLNNLINWNLTTADQATVDGYVTMVNDLGTLLKTVVTDSTKSPLTFAYGTGYSFPYTYPYGSAGYNFYPFRAEEKAVNTLALSASKATVPLVSSVSGDQNFTVTLSIGSNAYNCAGAIPILFDKTKLVLVGVNNAGTNVSFTPTKVGDNYSVKYKFAGNLNPSVASFWPPVYKTDTVFKAKWAGMILNMTQDSTSGSPRCVYPIGQENVLSLNFQVKSGATAGDAVIYIDPAFKRDVANRSNSLYLGRAAGEDSASTYDTLATYGASYDLTGAVAAVKIVGNTTISFDSKGGSAVASVTGATGSAVPTVTAPTKAGFTFAGWSPALPATFPASDTTYTATWTATQSTITFDSANGTAVAPLTGDVGAAVVAPANPTREGFTFAGWSPALPATFPAGGLAVTAMWTANSSIISVTTPNPYYLGQTIVFSVLVKGSPSKIQFTNLDNQTQTWTWTRTHASVISITPSGQNEIWQISMTIINAQANFGATAKYGTAWESSKYNFTISCATAPAYDASVHSVALDKSPVVLGTTSVVTVKTGLDATKVLLLSGTGATFTFAAAATPNTVVGTDRVWTISIKFTVVGSNSFTVESRGSVNVWNTYANLLTFNVIKAVVDQGRGVISVDVDAARVLQGQASTITIVTETTCSDVRLINAAGGTAKIFTPANAVSVVDAGGVRTWTVQATFMTLGDNTFTVSARYGTVIVPSALGFTVTVLY